VLKRPAAYDGRRVFVAKFPPGVTNTWWLDDTQAALTLTVVPDTRDAVNNAPTGYRLVSYEEYMLLLSGKDAFDGASYADRPLRFRWSSPGTYDEWKPDLTNSPPQWLSGYIDARGIGQFLDVFSYLGRVYCVMGDKLWTFTKVGGEVGFSGKELDVQFRYGTKANFGNALATSKGVFFLTDDGLYVFDGASANAVLETSEPLFARDWFIDTFSNLTLVSEGIRGLHVPLLDTVMWFVQGYDNTNAPVTVVLCYNYEQRAATYLQSPAGTQYMPIDGLRPGLAVWDTSHSSQPTLRCYTFERNVGTSDVPAFSYEWHSGYMTGPDYEKAVRIDRVYVHGLLLDANQSCTLTLNAYDQDNFTTANRTQTKTVTQTDIRRGYVDTRIEGRFVQMQFSWSPVSGRSSAPTSLHLKGLAVDAILTGSRP